MITALAIFAAIYLVVRSFKNRSEEKEDTAGSHSRMVKYRSYLRGKEFASTCVDGQDHDPMIVTHKDRPTQVLAYTCRLCSDNLEAPDWTFCEQCILVVVDGYVLHQPCSKHNEQINARQ